jgi:exosortase
MTVKREQLLESSPTVNAAKDRALWWQAGLLLVFVGFLYYPILTRLAWDWWNDPEASHGILVPAFSLYVVWYTRRNWADLPLKPSWWGLAIILGSCVLLVAGVLGAEFFLSRTSFVFLLAGLVIHFLGWGYFRVWLFPWAFLFLMIPIPAIILNHIAFPLQLLASRLASATLQVVGVPVLREGNVMQLASTTLEVAEACSGIRSLLTLVTLALVYGYFLEKRLSRRALFAVAAVPIAVVANALRVVGTGALAHYWDAQTAEGFFHTFSGWVIFVIAMVLLFSVDNLMRLIDRWRGRARVKASR